MVNTIAIYQSGMSVIPHMHINEISSTSPLLRAMNNNFDTVMEEIEKNCSDIINELTVTDKFLWAGLQGKSDIFIGKPTKNIDHADSDHLAIALYDWFLQEHGSNILLSQSITASSDYRNASEGGTPYLIFPVNGYSHLPFATQKLQLHNETAINDKNVNIIRDIMARGYQDKYRTSLPENIDIVAKLNFWKTHQVTVSDLMQYVSQIRKLIPEMNTFDIGHFLNMRYFRSLHYRSGIKHALLAGNVIAFNSSYYALNGNKYLTEVSTRLSITGN